MEDGFLLFAAVGFLAQLVDGALGMAYGVISSTVLMSFGVTPAAASAAVHAAELFTTATSASSHAWHRNVNWRLFWTLAPAGILGGVLGTYVLTSFDGDVLRPYVAAYLAIMGVYILVRGFFWPPTHVAPEPGVVIALGGLGGFADAVGGGGWGPVVATGLVGRGTAPRETVGTVNTVEFFLTFSVSVAFLTALLTGHWDEAEGLASHAWAVAGLIVGGVAAAPLAGYVTKVIPSRQFMILVGVVVTSLAAYQASRLF
ncbi:sulfite exporter TauE/SafE family protein [Rubellimicrobium roseum]|uniref:Probable membrane transporter protein n=1 Tax=Rubellimicrobium roseum TaxID=687525 RepID=A0A5C4N4C5_9RHOB|nr:sulfite exporter TauE/SafE family protein [Rubellimicrobium roseum]TNC62281.1 sulfite exporter TauE/SafE family protein [Rubellimicrobium roseum]